MKRSLLYITLFFVVTAVILFMVSKEPKSQNEKKQLKAKEPQSIELIFAHHMPKQSVLHKAAMRYANEVQERTKNKVTIKVVANQELGNSHEMIELSRAGEIDILATPTAKMSVTVPSMQYADLPFLFPQKEDAYALLDGKVGSLLLQDLNKIGLLGVAFWEGGFKNFTANRPLKTIEDFKDLKVRVMKSRIIMEQFLAVGAKPITIDFHQTKQALIDGAVDAQETSLSGTVAMGFHEVQSDFTLSQHGYLPYIISLSQKTISELPLDIQTVLIDTAKQMTPWQRQEAQKESTRLLEMLKNSKIHVHEFPLSQKEKFAQQTAFIIKAYEDVIGAHIVSKTQEYFYEKYRKQDVMAIGVDADLSMGAKGSGLAIKRGVELAVDAINKQGGLLEKELVVVAKDHHGNSVQAHENIMSFIEDKNIIGVIGGKHSVVISSYMKQIQDNDLIFISPWAAAAGVTQNGYKENYVFRVSLNDAYAATFLAQEMLKKSSNPIVVVENSVWGRGALQNINAYFKSSGLPLIEGIIINRGEKRFEAIFKDIITAKNDGVLMVLNSNEATKLVEHMGLNGIHLPVVSHWGMVGDNFFKVNEPYLENIDLSFIQTFTFTNNDRKEAKKLLEAYLKTYRKDSSKDINAPTGVVQGYDAVMLLAHAIQSCRSFDSKVVKICLENIKKYEGAIKTYEYPFSSNEHDALGIDDFFMATFDETGTIVPTKE